MGLYGAPTAPEHLAVVNKIASAIADNYVGKGKEANRHTRSLVLTFYACGANPNSTADPWHLIFHKRITDLRRAWAKRPHLRPKIADVLTAYNHQGRPDTCPHTQNDTIPVPRGKAIKVGGWICKPRPPGPIALAPQRAATHNSSIAPDLNVNPPLHTTLQHHRSATALRQKSNLHD